MEMYEGSDGYKCGRNEAMIRPRLLYSQTMYDCELGWG